MTEGSILRVVEWNDRYENNRTRGLKHMDWVPVPNKMDGDAYIELIDHPEGPAHFGCWIIILEIASKCDPRGTLLRFGGRAHDIASLSRLSRISPAVLSAATDRLLSLGWIEELSVNDFKQLHRGAVKVPESRIEVPDDCVENVTSRTRPRASVPFRSVPDFSSEEIPSEKFDDWWKLWSGVRGTNHRMNAEGVYIRTVTIPMEVDCFDCTGSYLNSLTNPAKGYNPENFLIEQARERFKARWPPARNGFTPKELPPATHWVRED